MLIYPQLSTGALSQFPIKKRRRSRSVVNTAADGSRVTYEDATGGTIEWQLAYTALSDSELAALQALHEAAEGSLNGFTFVDPTANLLAWSEDLSNAEWSRGPMLTATLATGSWRLANTGAGPQSITQTLNAPAQYQYCFSVSVRADQPTSVTLLVGANRASFAVGSDWTRISLARTGVTFGIELPAGGVVDVSAPQVEAQAAPSKYKPSTTGGVYENARLRDDAFAFTTTDVNRHAVTVNILYANHL
ncbi:MAG TPA: hypothetical protein VG456_22020 [Candidatus Sulfopaludibacter sp.]|jgi:hypothetical protein|nr:hypothetical protein [Candidatus Sulfopaludibacter sp.]